MPKSRAPKPQRGDRFIVVLVGWVSVQVYWISIAVAVHSLDPSLFAQLILFGCLIAVRTLHMYKVELTHYILRINPS